MAEWIMSHYKEGLHVLEVTGLPHSAPTILRHEGMMRGLEASDMRDIRIASVMGSWQRKDAYSEVKAYLAMHRDVDLIVAQNDLMAIGAAVIIDPVVSRSWVWTVSFRACRLY